MTTPNKYDIIYVRDRGDILGSRFDAAWILLKTPIMCLGFIYYPLFKFFWQVKCPLEAGTFPVFIKDLTKRKKCAIMEKKIKEKGHA